MSKSDDFMLKAKAAGLTPEEIYAVAMMRDADEVLRPDTQGGLLYLRNTPVCTWPTMFSLLGRGVCRRFPTTECYGLVDFWRVKPGAP